jgi:ABC-2 type transport system permease protein
MAVLMILVRAMFEITRHETKRRMVETSAVTVGLAGFTLLSIAIAPEIIAQIDPDTLAREYPKSVRDAFGIETLGTLPGFVATELYHLGWVLLLGLYIAYSAGSMIADEIERNIDVLLSAPVSRSAIVREKFFALLVAILIINVVVGTVVFVGTILIGEPLSPIDIIAVHALSIPYLLVCAAIGLLLSVSLGTSNTAQRASFLVVFVLFLIEPMVGNTYYEWLTVFSPTHYYNPTEILVYNTYDLTGAGVLLAATAVFLAISLLWFRQMDIR